MSFELSYLQLKTANDSRVADELQAEKRKRNLLVLVHQFLEEQGFLDTIQALNKECASFVKKYQVCDNIDLFTILQEYEAYYFVKFKKQPKIVKKVSDSADSVNRTPSKGTSLATIASKSSQLVCHLPPILGGGGTRDSDGEGPSGLNGEEKKTTGGKGSVTRKRSSKISKENIGKTKDTMNNKPEGSSRLEIEGTNVNVATSNHHDKRTINKDKECIEETNTYTQDRLLKPLAGFTGYSSEMRDLAAVISKDIYLENPSVSWDDIIGLDSAKRLIKEAVVYPIKYPQLFKGILSPWKGLLLYGPPGTGKTLLAKAVATECKTTFFNISASSIVSKWRGDSEKLVRVLFELARFHAPSTIFMDELESIMGQRSGFGGGGGEHEGSRRMKTELLVQMDGLSKSNDLVFLLAASNLPWDLDHAMLRRLEKRILVDLPTEAARKAMFMYHLPPVISVQPLKISSKIDYDKIAKKTEGYSGSDVFLVCKEAAMIPLRKVFDCLEAISDKDGGGGSSLDTGGIVVDPVDTIDVMSAIEHTKPSAKAIVGQYETWQLKYESC